MISDSAGCISLIDSEVMDVIRQWRGHAYEAWVATFDNWNNHIILSGIYEHSILFHEKNGHLFHVFPEQKLLYNV